MKKAVKGKGVSKKEKDEEVRPDSEEKTTVTIPIERDKLASALATEINKEFKEFKAVHFLRGPDSGGSAVDVREWLSTGDDILDIRISNRPHGGLPVGRITELTGLEASGKSLIVAHIIAEAQRLGGVGILYDTEFAASPEFLEAIGVNTTNLLHVQLECLEDIFSSMEKMIMQIREKYADKLVVIAVDSVAGATTKVEMESDYDKDGWATTKAIIMSKAMRKLTALVAKQRIVLVFTNQLRDKLGAMFGDKYTTSGGHALKFHGSVRLRCTKLGQIKIGKEPIGVTLNIRVDKNRVGPPFRSCNTNIYFDRGIDRYGSWLNVLKSSGLASLGGGKSPKVSIKGGIEIPTKQWNETLTNNTELREKLYDMICKELIMEYRSASETAIDAEIEITDNED